MSAAAPILPSCTSRPARSIPVPPFDFGRSLRFLEGFSPTEGEQAVASGSVRKATRVGGRTLLFEVRGTDGATVEHPELRYELWSSEPFDPDVVASASDRIGAFLSIEDDLAAFYDRARGDTGHLARTSSASTGSTRSAS